MIMGHLHPEGYTCIQDRVWGVHNATNAYKDYRGIFLICSGFYLLCQVGDGLRAGDFGVWV